jgi:hypothetical protein
MEVFKGENMRGSEASNFKTCMNPSHSNKTGKV